MNFTPVSNYPATTTRLYPLAWAQKPEAAPPKSLLRVWAKNPGERRAMFEVTLDERAGMIVEAIAEVKAAGFALAMVEVK